MSDPDRRPHERIEAALAQIGAEHEPPAGWEARVLAAVAAPRRRPWWLFAAPGLALAAAAVLLLYLLPASRPAALALDVTLARGAVVRGSQGDIGNVGDVARIATSGGRGPRAIWIYLDRERLVMRCPGDPACRGTDRALEADLKLTRTGVYTIVALATSPALPALVGTYDADISAAREAGVELREYVLRVP